jgi:hypothetical protein
VLGDQLTDQQVRYFETPEGFANLASGKIDVAKMLDDNVERQGLQEHGGGIGPRQHWQDLMQETVADVKSGMADIYRRLAPKIERHRDSFLAGQLYDELENYAELHGAEREFKQMMAGARNRAHMEYDTNPGGFHNWFWFLPFEDQDLAEMDKSQKPPSRHGDYPLGAKGTTANPVAAKKVVKDLAIDLDQAFAKEKPVKKKGVKEGLTDTLKFAWRELKTNVVDFVANAVGLPNDQRREVFVRAGNEFSNEVIELLANHPARDKLIPMVREIGGYMAKARTLEELKSLLDKAGLFLADVDAGKFDPPVAKTLPSFGDRQGMTENTDELKKKMSKLEALALAANRAGDDAKCKMYQQKIQSLKQKLSQSMTEEVDQAGALKSAQAAAKFIIRNLDDHAALKDYSMHFWSPAKFYQGATMAMRGAGHDEIVQHITQDRPAQFESGMAEGWSDAMVARRTGQPRTPYSVYIKGKKWKDFESDDHAEAVANKLRAKFKADGRDPSVITVAPADYDQPIKEDNDSEAVERAILNRIMVAHTDLLMKFGPDKVMQAAEEVAYNVGDVDEIGTSDVSAYVAQVKQILGATA